MLLYVRCIESASSKRYHMYTQFEVYVFLIFASRLQRCENMCHLVQKAAYADSDPSGYLDEFETADR